MTPLDLIPLEDLVEEIQRRTTCSVIAFQRFVEGDTDPWTSHCLAGQCVPVAGLVELLRVRAKRDMREWLDDSTQEGV